MERVTRFAPVAVATVLTVWTAWIFARFVPPFVDLPQHAWTLAMLRHPDAYADAFVTTLRPWNTNSFWFVVDAALAPVLSPEGSLALACFLAVVCLPLAMAAWARALGRSAGLGLLVGWTLAWTRSLHWGFVNYALSLPTAIATLALDEAALGAPGGRRGPARAGVAAAIALVYLQHAQTWAFLVGALTVQRALRGGGARGIGQGLGELALLTLPSVALFAPFALANLVSPDADAAPLVSLGGDIRPRFGDAAVDLGFLLENTSATVRWSTVDDGLVRCFLAAALAGGVRALLRRDEPGRRGLPALVVLAALALGAYLYAPLHVLGQFQIASRMAPWALLALGPLAAPALVGWAHRAAVGLWGAAAISMAVLQTGTFQRYEVESAPVFTLLAQMEPGRTAALWAQGRSGRSTLGPVYTHILGWYAARTLGRAHFSFAEFRPNPVVYRDPVHHPRVVSGEETKEWCAVRAGDGVGLDYVLTRDDTRPEATCGSVATYRESLREVGRVRAWALYEVVGPLPRAQGAGCRCGKRAPREGPPRLAPRAAEPPGPE